MKMMKFKGEIIISGYEATNTDEIEYYESCNILHNMMSVLSSAKLKQWVIKGTNLGWRSRTGYKRAMTSLGAGMLSAILPSTECNYKIEFDKKEKCIVITNSHHDAQDEKYYIYSLRSKKGQEVYQTALEEGYKI